MLKRWIIPVLASLAAHGAAGAVLVGIGRLTPARIELPAGAAEGDEGVLVTLETPAEPAAQPPMLEAVTIGPAPVDGPEAEAREFVDECQILAAAADCDAALTSGEAEAIERSIDVVEGRAAAADIEAMEAVSSTVRAIDAASHVLERVRADAMATVEAARERLSAMAAAPPRANSEEDGGAGAPNVHAAPGATEGGVSGAPSPASGNRAPVYPRECLNRGEQGTVIVRASVGVDGLVAGAEVSATSGFAALDRSAVEAVLAWKFVPAMSGGAPVECAVDVPVRFVLRR